MKIAQVIYTGFGGLGCVAISMIEADRERKHEWLVAFIGDAPLDPGYPVRCANRSVAWASFQTMPRRPFAAWWRLARWLQAQEPDAVIVHTLNAILPSRWAAWMKGAKLIAVEHTANSVKSRTETTFSRLSLRLADRVVLLTPEYRREVEVALQRRLKPEMLAIIPNGVDTALFRPGDKVRGQTLEFWIGMAARFEFMKKQELLIETLAELNARCSATKWRLSLAGSGSRWRQLRELAASRELTHAVEFPGLLDESALARWYHRLDVYAHASEGETLSTSLLQAMASGRAIVASDVPGIRNLLQPAGAFGCLAANTPAEFADRIAELAASPEERRAMGRRARDAVVANYSSRGMLEGYLRVIDGI